MRKPRFIRAWQRRRQRGPKRNRFGTLVRRLVAPIQRSWKWLNAARTKRSYRNLWLGLPSVIIAVFAVLLVSLATAKRSDYAPTYRRIALKSFEDGDFDSARVYLERVYRSGDRGNDVTFFLASTLNGQGESQRANAMIESLAPDDSVGFAEAHFMKAKVLLAGGRLASKEAAQKVFHHLDASRTRYAENPEWGAAFAKFYLLVGKPEEAVTYLRRASRLDPGYLFDLARLLRSQNRQAEALPVYEGATRHMEQLLSTDSRNNEARMTLGLLLSDQEQFERAYEVLNEGIALGDSERLRKVMAVVCIVHHDRLLKSSDPRSAFLRLKLLRNALSNDQNSTEAVRRLVYFGEEGGSDPVARKQASEFLQSLIATGQESPIAHMALGAKSWRDGKANQAKFHLKRAYGLDRKMLVLANNLSWVLAHEDEPKLDEALQMIESVVAERPDVHAFRDTRGQILAMLGRWEESLVDLEFALQGLPRDPKVHRALAVVYSNLSPPQGELRQKHEQIARAIEAKSAIKGQ